MNEDDEYREWEKQWEAQLVQRKRDATFDAAHALFSPEEAQDLLDKLRTNKGPWTRWAMGPIVEALQEVIDGPPTSPESTREPRRD